MGLFEKAQINLLWRARFAFAILIMIFCLLLLRLWYLQIVKGEYFREQSESNRFKEVFIPPPRGEILDRKGVVLVGNRPSFNIELVKEDSPDPQGTVKTLARLLELPEADLLQRLNRSQRKRRAFEPKLILKDISRDMLAKIVAHKHVLPGITVNAVPTRNYVRGEFGAHVLGYIREIGQNQLENGQYSGYKQGDLIGQAGIEQVEEYLLFGKRGVQHVVVNAVGVRLGELYYEPDSPGREVTLTIDADLQQAAEDGMAGLRGAVIAMNPKTGQILAMVSHPDFNPNVFAGELPLDVWENLNSSATHPLNNRAIQGTYPLGSVFKIIMATAGLAEGVISPSEKINCPGSYRVGHSRPFSCHKKSGHGPVALKEALKVSCNVFFFTVGQRLGIDRIHDYATRFGFGKQTGIGLNSEEPGLVPSTAWKRREFNDKWYAGETPSVAIGQGALSVTPIQVAGALSALVNGGTVYKPSLVQKVASHAGELGEEKFDPEVTGRLGVEQWVLDEVQKGLFAVANEQGGTGYARGRLPDEYGVLIAGKTGTAQTKSLELASRSRKDTDLAWFASYAPAEKPEIVVVVVVEDGGHGGVTSAPIARRVYEAYFKDRLNKTETAPAEPVNS